MQERLKCRRCGHEWYPQRPQLPKVCPRCKSYDYMEEEIKSASKAS